MAIKIQGTTVIDDSRNATNLGDITASGDVNFTGSGSFKVPSGTTAQRPASPSVGEIRYNTDNAEFEQYDGSAWVSLAPPIEKGSLDKTFAAGEQVSLTLSEEVTTAPIVSVTKEVPQTGVTSNDWDVASDGANYTLHDTAYDTTLTPGTIGYAIGSASYDNVSFDVSSQETSPQGMAINNDGTKIYIVGIDTDSVHQYTLSTPFDLSTASYDSVSFSLSGEGSNPYSITFNDDGTKLYMIGNNPDSVHQYTLSTPFDISAASYDNVSFDVSGQEALPFGITFNTDGTKMYIIGADDFIYQYSLSTAFDLNTASYDSVFFDLNDFGLGFSSIIFINNGTKMYATSGDVVQQYSLQNAFDITSVSYDGISFDVSGQDGGSREIIFNNDGSKLYLLGNDTNSVYQYTTSGEALLLGTGSFASEDVGKRIVGNGGEAILTATDGSYELQTAFNDTSTIAAGDWSMFGLDVESADAGLTLAGISRLYGIENATYDSVSFDVSGQLGLPTGIAFNTDGTKMYIIGASNDSVYQYSLTAGFDISTASYNNVSFSVATQMSNPFGIEFNTDGTKMYIVGGDVVYQYTLSTAFDLSTASYDSVSFDLSGQDVYVQDITFNNDGSKMYIAGKNTDSVYQYSLSAPFDLSTASYDNVSFDISGQDGDVNGITFNANGTKMYIAGSSTDSIYQYTLSTAFDLSSASYDSIFFDASGQETDLGGIVFNNDGTQMYLIGNVSDSVHQYTTSLFVLPTNTNHTAVTSTSTNTEFWTDINSMTANDTLNDGAVYYAVSTDDRTTWSVIDDTNGVRNIVRNNGGTWEVNDASDYGTETWVAATENDEFYALEEAVDVNTAQFGFDATVGFGDANTWSYDSVFFDVSSQGMYPTGITFNTDGTKMYIIGNNPDSVFQYSLTTSFDLSTASYDSVSFDVSGQETFPTSIAFNNDGSKMYIIGKNNNTTYQYSLSTSFDISTASYDTVSYNHSNEATNDSGGITFNNDGTKLYRVDATYERVNQITLNTPFDLSTASFDKYIDVSDTAIVGLSSIRFNNDGTKMYISNDNNDKIDQYTLSTSFDIGTASYDNVSYDASGQNSRVQGIAFSADGTKMYVVGYDNNSVHQYTTEGTETQFDSRNRMDSAQLNAVSDANHYTLGNDLDLAITLFMADGNTNSPTSDGVSINYDANVLNQGAVLGTDYEFDAPAGDTVRITALSDENFKVKVI